MKTFLIVVRTELARRSYTAIATSSGDAWAAAAESQGRCCRIPGRHAMRHHRHADSRPMISTAQFRGAIKDAAAYARRREPSDRDARCRTFIAALSGKLEEIEDNNIAHVVWEVLGLSPDAAKPIAVIPRKAP